MTPSELMHQLGDLIEESETGLLSTVDSTGKPHARWMTPTVLGDRRNVVFAVTCPRSSKIAQIQSNPNVAWTFHSKKLNRVVSVSGVMNILDNPSLKNEVIESLGPRLETFWKIDCAGTDLVVLETVVEEGTMLQPSSGARETIKFT
jgi:general stress protein 26